MALGADETALTKAAYGWPQEPTFLVPAEVRGRFSEIVAARRSEHEQWEQKLARWREKEPEEALRWEGYWAPNIGTRRELLDAILDDGVPGTNAELLMGVGDFLAVVGGRTVRFQAAYTDLLDIQRIHERLHANSALEEGSPFTPGDASETPTHSGHYIT